MSKNPFPSPINFCKREKKMVLPIKFSGKHKYYPSLPRFSSKGKKKELKLAFALSSPGSVNVPKHVVIVMNGLKEFTTELLEWVLENVSANGHIVTLVGFMPWLNIPRKLPIRIH